MSKLEVCPTCGSCHENGDKRIVAEVSLNWTGRDADLKEAILSTRFGQVIKVNAERGYTLESWRLHQLMTSPNNMIETIIAVFVKDE